jgi:NADH dehydrogenase (ubiquinone) Fe-S protein 5
MSSGFGIKGGLSRCYPFFAEYKECLKTETSRLGEKCLHQRDDYFECLHHKKEHEIVRKVNEQVKINEKLAKEAAAS